MIGCLKERKLLNIIILTTFIILPTFNNISSAQEENSAMVLYNKNVEFSYHQPMRNGYKSNHPSYIEIPRLNHILNLLQNYIEYLKKLERLTGNPNIRINYSPNVIIEEDKQNTRIIDINDLGLTNILQKVNNYLVEYGFAKEEHLIDNQEALYNLPDYDITIPSNFSNSKYFKNVSLSIPSNEPDTSYVIVNNQNIFTTRPGKKTNMICKLSLSDKKEDNEIFTTEAKTWYQNMLPSQDGRYLALTDGLTPIIIDLVTKSQTNIFPQENNISLLRYNWSPVQNLLAGIVLDESSNERYVFIYDAEKNRLLNVGNFANELNANHLYAMPFWSPDGSKLAFLSSKSVNLIDLKNNLAKSNLASAEGEMNEFIWSENAEFFAFTETKGQARNKFNFTDYDFKGSVLHKYCFVKPTEVIEDYAQQISSRNTIKLISFTDKNQIMYLEGKLTVPEVPSSIWDLSKTFNAYLTPLPSIGNSEEILKKEENAKPQQLPMQYLYVYRNLENKNTNIYDAGMGHGNLLYTDDFYSSWYIGLYRQNGISFKGDAYSVRLSPYPFQSHNFTYFIDKTQGQARLFMKFLKDFNIRSIDSDNTTDRIFIQANFSGILNIWTIKLNDLFQWLINGEGKELNNESQIQNDSTDDEM